MAASPYFFKQDCGCTDVGGAEVQIPTGIYNVVERDSVAVSLSEGKVVEIPASEFARLKAEGRVSAYNVVP